MIYANCGAIAVSTSTTYMTIVELFDKYPAPFSPEIMTIVIDHNQEFIYTLVMNKHLVLNEKMVNGSRIHVSFLKGPYLTRHEAGLTLSICLELQCSKMKAEEAQWTVRKTETAISVSLFRPSFSDNRGVNSSSMASSRKRRSQRRQHKKSGKHITNLGPTVSEKKQN